MRNVSGKDFARILENYGWELRRIKGSHHVYTKAGNPARISLPIHGKTVDFKKIGLILYFNQLIQRFIIVQAGLSIDEFSNLF